MDTEIFAVTFSPCLTPLVEDDSRFPTNAVAGGGDGWTEIFAAGVDSKFSCTARDFFEADTVAFVKMSEPGATLEVVSAVPDGASGIAGGMLDMVSNVSDGARDFDIARGVSTSWLMIFRFGYRPTTGVTDLGRPCPLTGFPGEDDTGASVFFDGAGRLCFRAFLRGFLPLGTGVNVASGVLGARFLFAELTVTGGLGVGGGTRFLLPAFVVAGVAGVRGGGNWETSGSSGDVVSEDPVEPMDPVFS